MFSSLIYFLLEAQNSLRCNRRNNKKFIVKGDFKVDIVITLLRIACNSVEQANQSRNQNSNAKTDSATKCELTVWTGHEGRHTKKGHEKYDCHVLGQRRKNTHKLEKKLS